ncbi:hypothetical protein KUV65_03825 [Maritalea mobilis]|uniref:hypothetical protein n=1 Tax=Maritalea mobilis TaxID=483324 RepID=UPI001C96D55E|nr:hypothetical protein [Maritalea mobilis]MBY6200479.1 hypothetical protein [Maritalea mobilis]
MPVDYRVLPDKNLVYVRYWGVVGIEESFSSFRSYVAEPLARAGQRFLIDLSEVTGMEDDIPGLIAFQAEMAGTFLSGIAPSFILYLAPTPTAYSIARMAQRSWEGLDKPVVVILQDEAQTFDLLGLPDMSLSDLTRRMA